MQLDRVGWGRDVFSLCEHDVRLVRGAEVVIIVKLGKGVVLGAVIERLVLSGRVYKFGLAKRIASVLATRGFKAGRRCSRFLYDVDHTFFTTLTTCFCADPDTSSAREIRGKSK
jgi:hypothetical protein